MVHIIGFVVLVILKESIDLCICRFFDCQMRMPEVASIPPIDGGYITNSGMSVENHFYCNQINKKGEFLYVYFEELIKSY